MNLIYPNLVVDKNNTRLTPQEASTEPIVVLLSSPPQRRFLYQTLVMHDPDAVGGNRIHWLVLHHHQTVFPYEGPQPPAGSGKHRYIFLLFGHDRPLQAPPRGLRRRISMTRLWEKLGVSSPLHLLSSRWFVSESAGDCLR